MYKKIFFIFLLSIILIFLGSNRNLLHADEASPTPSLLVTSGTGYPNDTVHIVVEISAITDLSALSFEIYYDATYLDLYASSTSEWLSNASTSLNHTVAGVFLFSFASNTPLTGSGTLVNLWFNIDAFSPLGDHNLTLVIGEAYDVSLLPITITGTHGTIHVIERTIAFESIYIHTGYDTREQSYGDIIQIDYSASQLKYLSAGDFTLYYDATKLEYIGYEMGGNFDLPYVLHSMNDTIPGYLKLSFAASQGIQYSYPIMKIRFKVIVDEDISTQVIMKGSNLYNHNLIPLVCSDIVSPISLKRIPPSTNFPNMTLSSYEGSNQDSFEIDVSLEGHSGLAAGDFMITYDVTKVRATSVQIHDDLTSIGGYLMYHETFSQGLIRFSYVNENGATLPGVLMTITFEPVQTTSTLTGSLTLTGSGVVDANLNPLSLDYLSSTYKLGMMYTITFKDTDDEIINTQTLFEGETILAPEPPLKVGYRFIGWDNDFSTATQNLIIKAIYEVDHSMQFNSQTVVYNGQPHTLSLTNLIDGASVVYSGDLSYTCPGEYTVIATIQKEGYEDLDLSATMLIQKATLTITAEDKVSPYGSSLEMLTYHITGSLYDTLEVTLMKEEGLDAGQYPITIHVVHPYYEFTLIAGIYTIVGRTIDISGVTFTSKTVVYDGLMHEILISGDLPYGVTSVEYSNHQATHVGTYYAVAHFNVLQGFDPIENKLAELVITPAMIEGITFGDIQLTYDGNPHSIEVSHLVTSYGDTLQVMYTPTHTFTDAGDHVVTATLSHPNYETCELTAHMIILKAELIITETMVEVFAGDTTITIDYDDETAPIYVSSDGIEYMLGRTLTGLDDYTSYTISIYIGESTNYLTSNILTFTCSTYRAYDDLIVLFELHEGNIRLSTYTTLVYLIGEIPHANPTHQETLTMRLNALIDAYDTYIGTINSEYQEVHDYLLIVLPLISLSSLGWIALLVFRKGRKF